MTMSALLKRMQLDGKGFLTADELKAYCKSMRVDYDIVVRYFGMRNYLVRIFRGVFYVKSPEELKLGRSKYTHLELVAKGLELKSVKQWYFGLHTALKLNNMTHETFTVEDVINDKLFRANPFTIAGYKFKFSRLSSSLLDFGITKAEKDVRYSDPEKTVLDFIYLWRYNGIPDGKIVSDVRGWSKNVNKARMREYSKKYPKTVAEIATRVAK